MKIKPFFIASVLSLLMHGGGIFLVDGLNKLPGQQRVTGLSVYLDSGVVAGPTNAALEPRASRRHKNLDFAAVNQRESQAVEVQSLLTEAFPTDEAVQVLSELGDYLESDRLTATATPLGEIDLGVADASALGTIGSMTLKLWIDDTGKVVRTEIESTDFSLAYSDSIVSIFTQAAFEPAHVNGQPVNSVLRIEARTD